MKIPKLLKKAAAFVMAAVTALSIMPATAFAAGDIGTISFSHTYDSNGNAMRYNSSANIGGYTAGGTGNYKYRMFVDGENAFCIQPGVPLKTGNTLKKASSDTWNALSANQKKAVGLALLYGYQGNRNNLSGSDDEKWLATQTLVWEFVTGCREATGSYNQTSTTVYSLHFGSNYANSGARAVYDQIVAMLREHNTIPSFMSGGKNDITKELAYKDGKYSITLTDSNGVLSDYSFSSSDSNVSVSKSGNKLTISSTVAISGSVRITAKRNNVPTVSSSAKLIAYGDPNLQDLVTGVENADTVSAYINIETPTGTIALKKTSEDGVVEGISFTIKGDNFNKTVKTGKDGSVSVEGLFPGTYTVTEQSIDRYEPQKTQTVTLIGGKTSTVTFSNTLKRGSLEIVKTSEDNLVEGMKFHLYGTSLSGLPVDEYAVTDKNGLAKFENVLISGDTPYVVEEVDTAVRYVVPASQTAAIEWNKVTKRSFDNVLKKFQVTVTKTDAETGSPQGDASLAGAVYGMIDRVGVNHATTATCFCDIHDDEVFAPIEKGAPAFDKDSDEHKYIYAYKAFIFEYYKKLVEQKVLRENITNTPSLLKTPQYITDTVHLFEAAIDLLSYATYLKCEGKDYKSESLLSLSGVYQPKKEMKDSKIPIALTTFLSANPQIKTIVLHLDNDKVGRLCTATLKELLQKDYKIVDDPPPVGKDFNDFLLSYLKIARPKLKRERSDVR